MFNFYLVFTETEEFRALVMNTSSVLSTYFLLTMQLT